MLDLLGEFISCEQSEVDILENSKYQFYLTGSWYFGTASIYSSDTDLVTEYSIRVETWLLGQGYELLGKRQNPYFEDQNVMAVYRKITQFNHIDIQLSTDITKKLLIQEILKKTQVFTVGGVRKSQARYIWQAMYMLYD